MEFGILGPLAVWQDGRELELGAAKQRALLAVMLLHAGETMTTERLVDALWGERPPATAVKALQVYVSQLRKTLGEGVVATRPLGYVIEVADGALDLHRFESLLADGRRLLDEGSPREAGDVLRQALALWRGEPLADFRYEGFAANAIGRLDQLRLIALEQRLEADLAAGRHADAVPELEALVRDHPLRESLRRLLMLALYRSGRQADALAAMQEARATLRDELGLDPGQPLQQLEKAILLQDPSLDLKTAPAASSGPSSPPTPALAPPVGPRPAAPAPVCASCGTTNARGADFCQACGAPLGADVSIERRKTVTVVFCDVVAYTELAGTLDPEALRRVMSRFFDLAASTIEHHGGTVEKFIGDEVMAVFGIPVVHEDDALRAVRAALDLRERIPALETQLESGARLEVRIGINTGEVVAGDPAEGHGFVTGDAVAVGKRLEQTAAPGEILLGEETHALVAHAVEATPLESLSLKGVRRELTAFRLESVDAEATAVPRRDDARFVGRERELERLRGLFADVAGGAGVRHVTILGEPGIGKSRLGREFLAELGSRATVLVGRCPPYGEGITFWPLREILEQIGRDESALAGSSHEVYAAARHILEELAAERPLVTVFDDVHWAEPTFLDFIEYLASRLGEAPVLLLCCARPQLADQRPAWLQEPAAAIVLEPLSEDDSQRLLEALDVPIPVRPRIAEAAEGNPLFVEQLAAIADENSTARDMPGSIRGVLHERLDRLGRKERSLLEHAAVAGRSFSLETMLDLTPPEERDGVQAGLLALVRKRFVRPERTPMGEGFRFHHALIRDATYDGIPKRTRADLHERVAERLEAQTADDELIGYHLEQAFRLREELGRPDAELGARAGRLLRAAGQKAFGGTDLPATVSLFERAGALLPADEAAELLPELGEALFDAGMFTEADDVLAEAIGRAAADPVLESRLRVEQQFVRLQADSGAAIGEAGRVAAAALEVFEQHEFGRGQCRAWSLRAWIDWNLGDVTAADEAWQRAAVCAQAVGDDRSLCEILTWRASAALYGPTPVPNAIETCTAILEQVRSRPVSVAVTLLPFAALHAMRGDFDHARSLIGEANAVLDDLVRMRSAAPLHEVLVETLAGNHEKAETLMRLAFEKLEEMGEKSHLATTAAFLAQTLYALERYEEADRFCSVSESAAAADDVVSQVIWRGARAKLLARQGRADEAETFAREAVRLIAQTDQLTDRAGALLDLAEVMRLAGRPDDSDAAMHEAIELYTRKGNTVSAEQARSLIASFATP